MQCEVCRKLIDKTCNACFLYFRYFDVDFDSMFKNQECLDLSEVTVEQNNPGLSNV